MKKLILYLLIVVTFTNGADAQIAIAPEAGLNMANMSLKTYGNLVSTGIRKSFTFGGSLDHGFTDHIYIQPGVFYVRNGCDVTGVGWEKINTLQVPVGIAYKAGMPGGNRFFVGAGPYFGYNISGSTKINDTSASLKIGNDKNKDDITAIDLGFSVFVGFQLSNNFFARLQYQNSINNLTPDGDRYNSTRTNSISIKIGYYFGDSRPERPKKKKKK